MRFAEVVSRLTGFSTPVFGVSWQPSEPDVTAARKVLRFLEDRRVLYDRSEVEIVEYCISSVFQMREFLTQVIAERQDADELTRSLRAMRAACRKFLSTIEPGRSEEGNLKYQTNRYFILNQALGELRGIFGVHVAQLAAKYGLDVEDQLASILPSPASESDENEPTSFDYDAFLNAPGKHHIS